MKKPPPIEYLQHLFKEEKFEDLADAAALLLREEPANVRALYWRACAYMRLDKMDAAMFDLDHAIDLFDEYADAYSQRGVLFFHKGDLESALNDMNKAVELDPDNPYRYSSRAYIKSTMDDLESAISDYEKAIQLDPEDAVAHNNLGLLQEKLGYKGQAKKNLEKADRMVVNDSGELVDSSPSSATKIEQHEIENEASYFKIIKDIFTTKEGLLGYWRYLKKSITKRM